MQNKKWKKFDKLTEKCYMNMVGSEKEESCWEEAFALLKEIVLEESQKNPDFVRELESIDDVTDYEYDIQGWLEDCLDEIDMKGRYETLLRMCDDLLSIFEWPEYTGSDVKFKKSAVLASLDRDEEAEEYCKEWIRQEPENVVAAAAGVYAFINVRKFDMAEELVDRFIPDPSNCTEENDIMFTAASKLYEAAGKKKEKKQIDKAMKEYEKYLEEYFKSEEWDEDELDFFDTELPFN